MAVWIVTRRILQQKQTSGHTYIKKKANQEELRGCKEENGNQLLGAIV